MSYTVLFKCAVWLFLLLRSVPSKNKGQYYNIYKYLLIYIIILYYFTNITISFKMLYRRERYECYLVMEK
jgi:hypothetical protein